MATITAIAPVHCKTVRILIDGTASPFGIVVAIMIVAMVRHIRKTIQPAIEIFIAQFSFGAVSGAS